MKLKAIFGSREENTKEKWNERKSEGKIKLELNMIIYIYIYY